MRRRSLIGTVLGLLALAAVDVMTVSGLHAFEYTIRLGQEQLQAAMNKKLPFEKKFARVFLITVINPKVSLANGSDRIGLATDLKLAIRIGREPKSLDGFIKSESSLRYDPSTFTFYLVKPEIQELQIQGVPEKIVKRVSEGSTEIFQKYITTVPVYKIKDKNLKLQLAKAVLKKVEIVDGKLGVTLGY